MECAHFLLVEFRRSLADRAEFADEALGEDGADGGCDEERLDPDICETGDGGRGVVGVEGGENQVAGEGCVDRDVGGLGIPDFPDHDDVGSLAEHGAEGGPEGHSDFRLHHHLVDAGQFVFHRILDRDDFLVRLVDHIEAGVERGGFP